MSPPGLIGPSEHLPGIKRMKKSSTAAKMAMIAPAVGEPRQIGCQTCHIVAATPSEVIRSASFATDPSSFVWVNQISSTIGGQSMMRKEGAMMVLNTAVLRNRALATWLSAGGDAS